MHTQDGHTWHQLQYLVHSRQNEVASSFDLTERAEAGGSMERIVSIILSELISLICFSESFVFLSVSFICLRCRPCQHCIGLKVDDNWSNSTIPYQCKKSSYCQNQAKQLGKKTFSLSSDSLLFRAKGFYGCFFISVASYVHLVVAYQRWSITHLKIRQ